MKAFAIFFLFCVFFYKITAYPSNSGLAVLRHLMERPSKMTVMITPEKKADPKINPTSARSGRGGQWEIKGSEVPLTVLEDLIAEMEYANRT